MYLAASNGLSSIEAKPTLSIRLYRDNAYGFGDDVSGLLTVRTEVSADVTRVEFYLIICFSLIAQLHRSTGLLTQTITRWVFTQSEL